MWGAAIAAAVCGMQLQTQAKAGDHHRDDSDVIDVEARVIEGVPALPAPDTREAP